MDPGLFPGSGSIVPDPPKYESAENKTFIYEYKVYFYLGEGLL